MNICLIFNPSAVILNIAGKIAPADAALYLQGNVSLALLAVEG